MTPVTLSERFATAFPRSRFLFTQAARLFPDGVTHETRRLDPFPIYVSRAQGPYKWTVEGHRLIDYFVGHGAHLLGHCPEPIVRAVQDQMTRGTHPGACHELEIAWAEWIQKLIPSAERLRFTSSGTEATMLALRLARLYTGKPRLLRFQGHFHGWHDLVTVGADPPYTEPNVPGIPAAIAQLAVVVPPNDLNQVEDTLIHNPDIGAVILEPTGGHWGTVPIRGDFLHGLREICTRHQRLLIFDEVITGFRVAPGGAQGYYNVRPDLTALAKILAGGLPGGCVAGRADVLAGLEARPGRPRIRHPGTYNANPLSAAAGITALQLVATGQPCQRANAAARRLRNRLNELFVQRRLPWIAYGDFSMVKILPHYDGPPPPPHHGDNDAFIPYNGDIERLDGPKDLRLLYALRQAMLLHGVDWWGFGGMTSSEHTDEVIDATITAFDRALDELPAVIRTGSAHHC
ncbi:MAG: aminotransferase class III-fold pyridoxal phosphate-dependent enzyme [Gemmataceae bacterium]|nr:aminotransferase class III-fold pyridoxal phosphate-dependent enzyme [Gemmataceae bacterium]MDW8243517.1 aminotransferase class III-fold pyridoxal phosphate-dependent enzyme [Thermogemmata sp.]